MRKDSKNLQPHTISLGGGVEALKAVNSCSTLTTLPTQLGPYTIDREIGRGGMGVVYLGHDTKLDRPVAIKALPEHLAGDVDRLARFEREAKLLASLTHSNIAGIYGLEEQGSSRFLVMEFVEGDNNAYAPANAAVAISCTTTAGCSPQQMAQNDIAEWNAAITTYLPLGQGWVCLDSTPNDGTSAAAPQCDGAGTQFTIKIWWDDDRDGVINLTAANMERLTITYQL